MLLGNRILDGFRTGHASGLSIGAASEFGEFFHFSRLCIGIILACKVDDIHRGESDGVGEYTLQRVIPTKLYSSSASSR